MKKFLFFIMLLGAVSAVKAQSCYVGASLGVQSVTMKEDGESLTQTAFQITPEFGYQFNKTFSVGLTISYQLTHISDADLNAITVSPYVRATFARVSIVDFFGEVAAGYAHQSLGGYGVDGFVAGLRPGMMVHVSPKCAIVARTQLLGYEDMDGTSTTTFGLNGNYTIGVQFNF